MFSRTGLEKSKKSEKVAEEKVKVAEVILILANRDLVVRNEAIIQNKGNVAPPTYLPTLSSILSIFLVVEM